jgi:hypothetical protein
VGFSFGFSRWIVIEVFKAGIYSTTDRFSKEYEAWGYGSKATVMFPRRGTCGNKPNTPFHL